MTGKPLSETHPELATQAIGWDPSAYTPGSSKKVLWRCELGHEWEQDIVSRTKRGYGCPYCSGHRVFVGFNDLATTNPEIAKEANGWDPTTITSGKSSKYSWKCFKGHVWDASVSSRTRLLTGCPYCSGRFPIPGFNDLASTNPDLASQAFGWDPKSVSAGSEKKMEWRCPELHTWKATVNSRAGQKIGCPYCSGRFSIKGETDLATVRPEIAAQAYGWDPTSVKPMSHKKVKWKCMKGHIWEAAISSRSVGVGCPVCSNQMVQSGFNDLATTNPEIAKEADGWDPTTVVAGSGKKHWWRCPSGHRYQAGPNGRTRPLDPTGCPYCSSNKVLKGFNDLATLFPEIASEAQGVDVHQIAPNSSKKIKWKCEVGHEWSATPNNRVNGTGCPSCAVGGFDPNADGWIYFLEQENWGMLQIGISNEPEVRLKTHGSTGWSAREVRGPMPGEIAYQWEQDILHALKRRNVVLGPENIAGKFDGYTEAWIQEDFPAKSLTELMQLVHNDEEIPKKG